MNTELAIAIRQTWEDVARVVDDVEVTRQELTNKARQSGNPREVFAATVATISIQAHTDWPGEWRAVLRRQRTEALLLDPTLEERFHAS